MARLATLLSILMIIGGIAARAQLSWQVNGPDYAKVADFSIGESGGQVVLYAAPSTIQEEVTAIVLKSADRGESWDLLEIDGVNGAVTAVATFPSNPNIVYAGVLSQGVYKSTDAGATWNSTALIANKNPGSFPTIIPRDLLDALTLRAQGRFSDAMVLLDRIVLSPVEDWIKEWALSEMLAASQGIRNNTLSSYLLETKSSFPSLSRVTDFLLPHAYQDEGLWEEAFEMFESNMNAYPESELERDALYGMFLNFPYTTPDTASALEWFEELDSKYPESDEAYLASYQLETFSPPSQAPRWLSRVEAETAFQGQPPMRQNSSTLVRTTPIHSTQPRSSGMDFLLTPW